MNRSDKMNLLPALYLLLGLAAFALRSGLYAMALEDSGLLTHGHWTELLLWSLTAAAAAAALFLSRRCRMGECIRASGCLGDVALALGILLMFLQPVSSRFPVLTVLYRVSCGAAAVSMAASAVMRVMGRKPFFAFHAFVCVYSALQMICCYQLWSELPQMQDFVFAVGGILCLMLFSYWQTARDVELKGSSLHGFAGLMGIFCFCAAIPNGAFPLLYAACAIWMTAELTGLQSAAAEG